MAIGDIIVGIDIGTSKVSTVVGEVNNFNQIEIICSTSSKCSGIVKGKISSEDEIGEAIAKTIKIAPNTITDQYGNTSNEHEFDMGTLDETQPEIYKVIVR